MQKNHPKSNVLRQTKICVAAAAVVAAVLPVYVQAQAVPQQLAQWEINRNDRISEIASAIGGLRGDIDRARITSRFADGIDIQLSLVNKVVADAVGNKDREKSFKHLASSIADDLKIEDALLTDAGRKQKLALSALKEKLEEAAAAAGGGRQDDIDRAQKALETEVAKHARFLADSEQALEALKREARLLGTKRDRVQGVTSEVELNGLTNTRQLRVTTSNVATLGGALTWSDRHLTNFMGADATTDTHNALGKDSILEFTRRSGEESDAIGGTGGVRDVGTLHARGSADHDVRIDGGTLNVHRTIGGEGRLGVTVGKGGTLHFADGGIGVSSDAKDVTLWAGRSEKGSPEGGAIEFGKHTSAGTATIILRRGGSLHFAEGANAGVSDIDIAQGASATFHSANAAIASIQNDGTLTLQAGSKAGRADIVNQSGALATFRNADLQRAELVNLGTTHLERTAGGSATFINGVDAHVDAHVDVLDSDLQQLGLANVGVVTLRGNTQARDAKIEMLGGKLNIADIEATASEGKPDKTLSLGSLSGIGKVVTGQTKLVLGERNEDDRFDGEILREEASSGDQSNTLRRATRSTKRSAVLTGASVVKVGTGDLTLGGDQRGVDSLRVEGGSVTAAHANALGSGTVTVTDKGGVKLASDVDGVNHIDNAGRIDLGTNKLAVQKYTSKAGAKISSHVSRVGDNVAGGAIQVSEDSDFTNTAIDVTVANDIALAEVQDKLGVVSVAEGKTAKLGKVTIGSIVGGKTVDPTDPTTTTDPTDATDPTDPSDPSVVVTSQNIVQYLATDGNYSANERAVLASVDGVTVGDLTSGRIGGKVLSEMALQTAGSGEQRRSASLLSGESLVNNALAAQGATTAFQRGMQSRMLAGGAMFDDKTANGANADSHGVAGWASFSGGNTSQRSDALSFDVRGIDGAIGVDKRIGSNTVVGASIGMGNQNSKAKSMPGESKINSVSVGLYGSYLNDANLFVGGGVSYTRHSVTTDRTVAARDASARLSGKTSGNTLGAFGEIGKRLDVAGFNVDPSVGVRLASTRLNAFDETNRDGAGNDGLKVGAQSQTSARSVLGVRLSRDVIDFDGGKVTPMLRLAYEHEFGNTQTSLTNSLYGAPRAFSVKGAKLGRDVFTADLGVDLQLKKRFNLHVGGNVSVRQGERALGGGISAKYRF